MAKYNKKTDEIPRRSPPATTLEGRESQMVALAMDRAEQRLRSGTASAQEITYLLKLGSINNRIERDILEKQRELIAAKTESIKSARRVDELYSEAIKAMKRYAGDTMEPDDED